MRRALAYVVILFSVTCVPTAQAAPILVSKNGSWCWFQDERAVVDKARGLLLVGSIANRDGPGGIRRDGDVDVSKCNLRTGLCRTQTLKHGLVSGRRNPRGDDHNAPALLVLPNRSYLSMYAGHNNDKYSYYRRYRGGRWSRERVFNWNSKPGGSDFPTTYSNLHYLSNDRRVYNFARSDSRSPNIAISGNLGRTWRYGGRLTESQEKVGYVDGYFKYASDGRARVDFVATEHHPSNFRETSLYHGFFRGGRSYDSAGRVIDPSIVDQSAPEPREFTPIFRSGTRVDGMAMTRLWQMDVETYPDGTVAALFQARANDSSADHRFFYARYDGASWRAEYLGRGGPFLYPGDQDYTGVGSIAPDDSNTVYLSTPFDPRNDRALGVHEIFEGKRDHSGWTWRAVTRNSRRDNLRPILPEWDGNNRALVWLRGTYETQKDYDMRVVAQVYRCQRSQVGEARQCTLDENLPR